MNSTVKSFYPKVVKRNSLEWASIAAFLVHFPCLLNHRLTILADAGFVPKYLAAIIDDAVAVFPLRRLHDFPPEFIFGGEGSGIQCVTNSVASLAPS